MRRACQKPAKTTDRRSRDRWRRRTRRCRASFFRTCCQVLPPSRCGRRRAPGSAPNARAQHRRERDVGVLRVHDHRADLSFLLPDVRPGLAARRSTCRCRCRPRRCRGCWLHRIRRRRRSDRTARRRSIRSRRSAGRRTPDFQVRPAVGRLPHAAGGGGRVVDRGSPGTPATRETRPPAAGPMVRYLSALNGVGASGSFCP